MCVTALIWLMRKDNSLVIKERSWVAWIWGDGRVWPQRDSRKALITGMGVFGILKMVVVVVT